MVKTRSKVRPLAALAAGFALAAVGLVATPTLPEVLDSTQEAHATTTGFWGFNGPGVSANVTDNNSTVTIAGKSASGQWSGAQATTANQMPASGTLNVVMRGNLGQNCEEGACPYGTGSGSTAFTQFRFDDQNFYKVGILDEGYVTWGPMLLIEGTQKGKPFRILEPLVTDAQRANNASMLQKIQAGQPVDLDQQHYVRDYRHLLKAQWTPNYIMFVVDNTRTFGGYLFTAGNKNGPSVTFIGAAKQAGDQVNAVFDMINFSGKVPGSSVFIPAGKPYAMITANVRDTGYGTGHSAYIKFHDDYGSAVSAGIQTAATAPETGGAPWVISGRMQDGIFDYNYIQPSSHDWHNLRIEWWKDSGWAVIWYDGKPIANMKSKLRGRLYFSVEGNAALNGDMVHAFFSGVDVQVGHSEGQDCGVHGDWSANATYGLNARRTGAGSYEVSGVAQGIPKGKDWDTTLVGGTVMTWQYQPENLQPGTCMGASWATGGEKR
ncbi:MAG: hypothetical protein Q4G30_01915 [Actinomycetaceae bacterium]|nr:hypothetical protein [Actinomycetaceae bacterium]